MIQKHGVGQVIPEEKDNQKTAAEHWTEEDAVELEDELASDK